MRTIWIISDTHFWHQNIYKFVYTDSNGVERRVRERFADAAEGDAYMIQRWSELVKPEDHIWHLGDICMNRVNQGAERFVALFRSLPGHKRWVPGNHDCLKPKWYVEAGFEKISGGRSLDGMLFTHYPVHPSSLSPRIKANVHGHTHQRSDIGPHYLNVSVERTSYAPISLDEIKQRLRLSVGNLAR